MDVAASVFISYSGQDLAVGERVCWLLEEQGIGCWIASRDVMPGHDYGEQIIDAIESTRVMVLILSEHANASIFVKNEVERAISKGKVVIPLRIQNVQPSRALELFVSRSQWVDAWTPPMESRVAVLGAAIRGLLGLPPLGERPAGPDAAAATETGKGWAVTPLIPAAQVPSPPSQPRSTARAAVASRVARLPRSARIAAVVSLAALFVLGGFLIVSGSGSRGVATRTLTSGFIETPQAQTTATATTATTTTRPGSGLFDAIDLLGPYDLSGEPVGWSGGQPQELAQMVIDGSLRQESMKAGGGVVTLVSCQGKSTGVIKAITSGDPATVTVDIATPCMDDASSLWAYSGGWRIEMTVASDKAGVWTVTKATAQLYCPHGWGSSGCNPP